MSVLEEILAHKRAELARAMERRAAEALESEARACASPLRGFAAALRAAPAPAVIAELKRRSPSKGLIRPGFDPVRCALAYQEGGAAAISVLTDERYFGGELGFLGLVRDAVSLPLLRKDFIIDPYQVDESRLAGADAILLIAAALAPGQLATLHKRTCERGLDALVEVHDEAELEVALASGATLVGVNNRDLRSFEVDLATTERVAAHLTRSGRSDVLLVAESGIHAPADVERLRRAGAGAFLVGESLMRQQDVAEALRRLRRSQ